MRIIITTDDGEEMAVFENADIPDNFEDAAEFFKDLWEEVIMARHEDIDWHSYGIDPGPKVEGVVVHTHLSL